MKGRVDGWIDTQVHRWKDGWRIDGWVDVRMGGGKDGWINLSFFIMVIT